MTDHLIVPIELPAPPNVLASSSFLSTLATVEEQAATLKVTDAASAQLAAQLQVRLTKAGSDLEAMRVSLTAPYLQAQRKIAEVAKGPASRIEAAKGLLKQRLTAFDTEQRAKAAEAERVRQAELRRLEEIRQAEIVAENKRKAELEKLAQEAAARAKAQEHAGVMDFDDEPEPPPPEPPQKTETQVALETLKHTPAVAAVRPAGITYRTTLVPVVTDVNKLPDMFVTKTPNLRAIAATFCAGFKEGQELPVLDGCKFEVKKDAVSSGRGAF